MKTIFIFLVLLLGFSQVQSQSIGKLMSQDKSYSEICDIKYQKFKNKSFSKKLPNYSREYKQFKRWEYFWKYRLLPNGEFPTSDMVYNAWQSTSESDLRGISEADWEYFGPKNLPTSDVTFYPGLGRINSLAVHPDNHNVIFAGGAGSGIWKTIDKGENWSSKTDDLPNVGISDIIFDPNNANIIYAATGDADGMANPFSTGLFKSTDLGETWSIVSLGQDPSAGFSIRRMAMPNSPANTLLITTTNGIQKSSDGGVTFTTVSDVNGFGIFKSTGSDTDFYVGTIDGKIYKSTDTGENWTDITPSSPSLSDRVELGVTANDPNFLLAIDQMGTIIISNDGGSSWSVVTTPPQYESQGGYNMTVAVSPNDKNRIVIGGINGWRSTDGGTTWENYLNGYWEPGQPYFYVHSDHHIMTFMPGGSDTLLVGNDGGVHYGDISGDNAFTDISDGLFITQYYGLGALRTDAEVIIAGAQDNDGTYINGDNTIGLLAGSDGFDGMIDYSDPNISYAATIGGYVEKTTDSWQTASTLSIPEYETPFEVPMAMHPTDPSTIFFGGNKLMKSTNRGGTWNSIYDAPNEWEGINELAIAPSNADVIAISTNYGFLQRSTDGGENWTEITSGLPVNFINLVSGIAIHATKPDVIYVSISGFDAGNKIFKSEDAGQNWTNISYNLPNIPVNHIAYAAGTQDDVYIATDLGIYLNSNNENTWTFFNTNLPYTQVMEIDFHYGSNTIFAATYGRGIWKSPLANDVISSTSNIEEKFGMKIYPTLNNGVFNIECKNLETSDSYQVIIFNSIGGVVYHQEHKGQAQKIDISNAVNGTYFVSISKDRQLFTQKIIINDK